MGDRLRSELQVHNKIVWEIRERESTQKNHFVGIFGVWEKYFHCEQ